MQSATLETMIDRVRQQKARWDFPMQPPCSEPEIKLLADLIERELGVSSPPHYLDLLRITNGFNENGLRVFGSQKSRDLTSDIAGRELSILGIIEVNKEYRDNRDNYDQLIVFAETEAYVCAQAIKQACSSNFFIAKRRQVSCMKRLMR